MEECVDSSSSTEAAFSCLAHIPYWGAECLSWPATSRSSSSATFSYYWLS